MSEFIEKYPHEAGFAAHYAREIAPLLDKAEALRRRIIGFFVIGLLGSIAASLFTAYMASRKAEMFWGLSQNFRQYLFFFTVLGCLGLLHWIYKSYGHKSKELLMPALIRFFNNTHFELTGYLGPEITKPFGIVPDYDSYRGEDKISEPSQFTACELKLTRQEGSGKNRRTVTDFRGLAVLFDLPRAVTAPITVRPDSGKIGNWLAAKFKPYGEKIALEDPVFERLFEVYSPDQIESRRVLQPALMLRLVQLGSLMKNWGQDLAKLPEGSRPGELPSPEQAAQSRAPFSMAMRDSKMLMLVPCPRDLFETGSLFKSAYNSNEIRCTLYQIHLLQQINAALRQFPQLVS